MTPQDIVALSDEAKLIVNRGAAFFGDRHLTVRIAGYLRSNQAIWSTYQAMCRAQALGNFAQAISLRATIVGFLEGAGIVAVGEVALPLIVFGGFFFLATSGAFADTSKKPLPGLQAAQDSYKLYLFQQDMLELNIGGVHLGPTLGPKLTFAEFIRLKYPQIQIPTKEQVIQLKW